MPPTIKIKKTSLKIITSEEGSVMHSLRKSEEDFFGFGESYFSTVEHNSIKAWKKHERMTLNLTVPVGSVKFVFIYDLNKYIGEGKEYEEIIISPNTYLRLTVPPGIWFGFKGLGKHINLISNIADIEHDPSEVERKSLSEIEYNWKK